MVSNALEEAHVVQATGPCAYAAAFLNVFGNICTGRGTKPGMLTAVERIRHT